MEWIRLPDSVYIMNLSSVHHKFDCGTIWIPPCKSTTSYAVSCLLVSLAYSRGQFSVIALMCYKFEKHVQHKSCSPSNNYIWNNYKSIDLQTCVLVGDVIAGANRIRRVRMSVIDGEWLGDARMCLSIDSLSHLSCQAVGNTIADVWFVISCVNIFIIAPHCSIWM